MSDTLWIKMANLVFELEKKLEPASPLDRTKNKMNLYLKRPIFTFIIPLAKSIRKREPISKLIFLAPPQMICTLPTLLNQLFTPAIAVKKSCCKKES
jgi:hypothetical protein